MYVAGYECVKLGLVSTHKVAEYIKQVLGFRNPNSIFIIWPPLLLSSSSLAETLLRKEKKIILFFALGFGFDKSFTKGGKKLFRLLN